MTVFLYGVWVVLCAMCLFVCYFSTRCTSACRRLAPYKGRTRKEMTAVRRSKHYVGLVDWYQTLWFSFLNVVIKTYAKLKWCFAQ